MASFPGAIYPVPTFGTNMSDVKTHTTWRDEITDEVRAIELELGTTPSGSFSTVAARLADYPYTHWTAYTPALGGAGWSLGSTGATAFGAYHNSDGVVHFNARLIFGTVGATFNAGVTVSLPPFTAEVSTSTRCSILTEYRDASAGVQFAGVGDVTASTVTLLAWRTDLTHGSYASVTSTLPMTWAASDEIRVSGWYRQT